MDQPDLKTSTEPQGRWYLDPARLALGLVLLNLLWRVVRYALAFPVWGDEAFLVTSFMTRDFNGMLSPLEYGQTVPLGFMWANLAVIRVLGTSELAMRLLPFCAGVLSMVLFWRFARRLLEPGPMLLAVAVFAASYYPVRHATEVKPFAIDLLVSLVLLYLAWRVTQRPDLKHGWILLTAAAVAAVWVSYPAVFVAAGVGGTLVWIVLRTKPRRGLLCWCAYGVLAAASFAAMFLLYARPQATFAPWLTEIETWVDSFPPLAKPWRLPVWAVTIHTGNMLAYPVGGRNFGSTVTLVLVLIGCVTLWRTRRRLLLLLLSPLPFLFAAAAMRLYPYGGSARVSLFMAPTFCILAGVGLFAVLKKCVSRRRLAIALLAAAGVLAALVSAGVVRNLTKPYKRIGDRENRRVVRQLARQTEPHDRWVVFNALLPVSWAPNLYQWGGSAARFRYYLTRLSPVPVRWAPPAEQVAPTPHGRTWLIAYQDNDRSFPEEQLAAYLVVLTTQLGPPREHLFSLQDRNEALRIYEFPASK